MRQRARVSKGSRGGRTSRACKAERRAEEWAREGGGDGRGMYSVGFRGLMSSSDSKELVVIRTAADD